MTELPKVIADADAMKRMGNTMVVWDFHARRPIQTLAVPGVPLPLDGAALVQAQVGHPLK